MRYGLAVVLSLLAVPATAQTHPCDVLPPTSATVTEGQVTIGWCHDLKDANGNTTTVAGWAFYANGVRTSLSNVTTNNVPNAAGLIYFLAAVNMPRGNYTIRMAAVNSIGEGALSDPFALAVVAPAAVPSQIQRVRVF
jgi:predicted phage tail protein